MITFWCILAIFCQKGVWSHVQRLKSKFDLPVAVSNFWGMSVQKVFDSRTFRFCRDQKGRFFFILTQISGLAAFLGTTPNF